jgi:Phage tail tube protein, GTA-gp10
MTATNPHKGDVSFTIEGKEYTLRYSHLALANLEKDLDKGLIQIIDELSNSETMRIGTMIALLRAGLQKYHPDMTREDAAGLLDDIDGGTSAMMTHINKAFDKAFGPTLGTKGTNPIQANGIGTQSSSTMSATASPQIPSGTSRPAN